MAFIELREAAQQVLEACEQRLPLKGQAEIIDELNSLRAALAEPVQEFASIPGTNVRVRLPVQEPAQKTEMRRCPRCWEPMFPPQPTPLTVERLRDALVAARIVPPAAVEDPDGYDDGVTLHRIEALHRRLA